MVVALTIAVVAIYGLFLGIWVYETAAMVVRKVRRASEWLRRR